MFHAERRAADRRCHARPEDRAGDVRGQGARRGPQVHSERLPFQTNPTSLLTPRTHRGCGEAVLCRDFRCGFDVVFFAAFSFAGFLPEIASSISFCPAAAFLGFFVAFEAAPCRRSGAAPPSGRRRCRQREPSALPQVRQYRAGLVGDLAPAYLAPRQPRAEV